MGLWSFHLGFSPHCCFTFVRKFGPRKLLLLLWQNIRNRNEFEKIAQCSLQWLKGKSPHTAVFWLSKTLLYTSFCIS